MKNKIKSDFVSKEKIGRSPSETDLKDTFEMEDEVLETPKRHGSLRRRGKWFDIIIV